MKNNITTIDEIDFEDDDFEVKPENCIAIFNSTDDKYIGTGFIIDNKGIFLSAGHNFKNKEIEYKAYFRDCGYEIKSIYYEYDGKGKDLFIGQLLDFHEFISNTFSLATTDKLKPEQELDVYGFNGKPPFGIQNSIKIGDHTLFEHKVITQLTTFEKKEIDKTRHENDDERLKDENIKLLTSFNTKKYSGLSGGPVYFGNKIYGICIADLFIPIEYVLNYMP